MCQWALTHLIMMRWLTVIRWLCVLEDMNRFLSVHFSELAKETQMETHDNDEMIETYDNDEMIDTLDDDEMIDIHYNDQCLFLCLCIDIDCYHVCQCIYLSLCLCLIWSGQQPGVYVCVRMCVWWVYNAMQWNIHMWVPVFVCVKYVCGCMCECVCAVVIFIGKVVSMCLVDSVNLVLKNQGQPGEIVFHWFAPWNFIGSPHEFQYLMNLRWHAVEYFNVCLCVCVCVCVCLCVFVCCYTMLYSRMFKWVCVCVC